MHPPLHTLKIWGAGVYSPRSYGAEFLFFVFLPCDAMRCTVFGIVILFVRLSVCLSVCLSDTLVDCVHIVRPTIMIVSGYGSPIILVSGDITLIPKYEGGHPERGHWLRVGTNWRFSTNKSPYLRNGAIRQRLLLITNRKSYTRFRLVPKSTTLVDPEVTLNGN